MKRIEEYRADGYLTVFLSLILTVMMSFCLVLIQGARENTRRLETECVTDIGMDSILAEYHRELMKQYDLFFIDTSYGTSFASYEQTEEHLKRYLEKNLGGEEVFLSILYHNMVKLSLEDAEITGVSAACDEDGAVFRRQAVDVMYGRVGADLLQEVQNWLTVTKNYSLDTRDVWQEQQDAYGKLAEWDGVLVGEEGKEQPVKVSNPGGGIIALWKRGLLNILVKEPGKLSNVALTKNVYLSTRQPLIGTGMNPDVTFSDSFWDQLVFQEYVMSYTGNYRGEKEGSLLKYQTEYILAGKNGDIDNLKHVVNKLLGIRTAANAAYLVTDEKKMALVRLVSNALATLTTIPELEPLFETVIVCRWAMAEGLIDMAVLLAGGRIPLIKTARDWYLGLEQMLFFASIGNREDKDKGLKYEDYLRVLLCLQSKRVTTMRLMDIIEMDIRQTPGNRFFRMDGCIDSVTAKVTYKAKDGKTYQITRNYGY